MNRRTILKYTAYFTGAAVSAPLISAVFSGCQSDVQKVDNYVPQYFEKQDFELVKTIIDLILPKTDSPSATELGVHQVIDTMINNVYDAEDKADFQTGFLVFKEHITQAGFINKKAPEQLEWLQQLHSSEDETLKSVKDIFLDLKQQTITYYLSTEEISTQYLNYLPVPGEYQPCISVEEAGGKLWAI